VQANRVLLCFSVAVACIAWVVMIRPAVSAREHGVLLQNMTRDVFVPWSSIERTRAMQTLQVVTAGATYHGLGVTRSARSLLKEVRRGPAATSAFGGRAVFGDGFSPREPPLHQSGGSYQSYVEARLQDLAATRAGATAGLRPTVSWATMPVGAMLVAAICVALMFL
jgi:Bacterial PH domain